MVQCPIWQVKSYAVPFSSSFPLVKGDDNNKRNEKYDGDTMCHEQFSYLLVRRLDIVQSL